MASCNYHLIDDGFSAIESKLADIEAAVSSVEIQAVIESLDLDLDNIEAQLIIANKLKLLELIGTDIMTEEEQTAAYEAIRDELFVPSGSAGEPMNVEEGD